MRFCVMCDNIPGGTQIVEASPESYSELTFLLQRHLRFKDPRSSRISGIHVYNNDYGEWVPVDTSLRDLGANNKIRVQCDIEDSHPKAAMFFEELVALFVQEQPTDRRHQLEDAIDAAKALAIQDKEASIFDMRAKQSFQVVANLIKGGNGNSSHHLNVSSSSGYNKAPLPVRAPVAPAAANGSTYPDAAAASRIAMQARNKAAPPPPAAASYASSAAAYDSPSRNTPYHALTGLHGTSPSRQSAAATTSPRTGAYRHPNAAAYTTADIAPKASITGSGLSAVAAISTSSASSPSAYRKAVRTPAKATNSTPTSAPSSASAVAAGSSSSSSLSGNITIFCVYSGTTSQRAKAIQVQRSNPGFNAIINVLRQKFNSDLSLGHISADGECTEITDNDDLRRLAANCGASLTLHCWAKAGVRFNELSMASANGSMMNNASRPQSATGSEYGDEYRTPKKRVVANRGAPSSRASNVSARSYRTTGGASAVSFTPASDRDVSGTAWNTKQLREVFHALDVDGSGYLTKDEMMNYFRKYHDDMGIVDAEKKFSKMLDKCKEMDDGLLSFDEFSVIMLRVAQW